MALSVCRCDKRLVSGYGEELLSDVVDDDGVVLWWGLLDVVALKK